MMATLVSRMQPKTGFLAGLTNPLPVVPPMITLLLIVMLLLIAMESLVGLYHAHIQREIRYKAGYVIPSPYFWSLLD